MRRTPLQVLLGLKMSNVSEFIITNSYPKNSILDLTGYSSNLTIQYHSYSVVQYDKVGQMAISF